MIHTNKRLEFIALNIRYELQNEKEAALVERKGGKVK